jgi:hypothetical protein
VCRIALVSYMTFPNFRKYSAMKIYTTHIIVCLVLAALLFDSCSSGKKSYVRGNYYDAVITSTNRLRRDPNHTKSEQTLREAYPLAVAYYDDRAKAAIATNAEFKWSAVVDAYTTINVMYDEIRRSPGALKVIPNPVNYYDKLADAKQQAAEENYRAGVTALSLNTRERAKDAYRYFRVAEGFVPNYKDVNDMLDAALWAATIKVVMEPIPVQARNISVSAEFFDNRVSEYLHSVSINEFVKFYTRIEAQTLNLTPDHVIKIAFDDFAVGQIFLYEKEYALVKDSIIMATYVTSVAPGIKSGDGLVDVSDKREDTKDVTGGDVTEEKEEQKTGEKEEKKEVPVDEVKEEKKDTPSDEKREDKDIDPTEDTFGDEISEKDRVTVCHLPPGNPEGRHSLVISKNALAAHLAHGDVLGACEDQTPKGKGPSKGNGGPQSVMNDREFRFISLGYLQGSDTIKIYGTVKATYLYSRKTTTSKGTINFQITEAPTNRILAVEKMPGEHVWISEWAIFNGDERALTPRQLEISKQREQVPPPPQDLFIEFTRPIFDQVITKISEFYKNY